MTERRIRAATIPADGKWHVVELTGPVVGVGNADEWPIEGTWVGHVDIWYLAGEHAHPKMRAYRIFATDEPIPPAAADYVGTAVYIRNAFGLPCSPRVWHVMEHEAPASLSEAGG